MFKREFPENEWQCRRGCKINLLQIRSALEKYLKNHDNKMPIDLNELAQEGLIDKLRFICPSQRDKLKNDTHPSIEYSYKVITPSTKLSDLGNGTILVEEKSNNHPESKVGDISYHSGYYVIMLKNDELIIKFIE
jgi:hypothetical protein